MKEIHNIISGMTFPERKAARRYFSQKYQNTKELRLFNMLEQNQMSDSLYSHPGIKKLGYDSVESKSFQKLKIRLRNKLFDFLLANTSSEGAKITDKSLFLHQRLRKLNLQANILREKSYLNQSRELLTNTARIAKENGQYDNLIDAMKELKKIHETRANYAMKEKIISKIKVYKELADQLNEYEEKFTEIISRVETDFLDFTSKKLRDAILVMRAHQHEFKSEQFDFMTDHLQVLLDQGENAHSKALPLALNWSRIIKENPAKFPINLKLANTKAVLDNLVLVNKKDAAIRLSERLRQQDIPLHQRFSILLFQLHDYLIIKDMRACEELFKSLEQELVHTGKMQNQLTYYNAFYQYRIENYRKVLDIINDTMRNFSCTSHQQLDFMLLEIICLFNMDKLDLLEYRIQGYNKNLAYRKKFDVPAHYNKCGLLLSNLLRTNYNFQDEKVKGLFIELQFYPINGLLSSASLIPVLFLEWFRSHSAIESVEIEELGLHRALSEAIF